MKIITQLTDKQRIFVLYFVLIFFLIYLIKPVILPAIISAFLAYITYPIYLKTKKIMKFKTLASLIVTLETILVVILPFIYLTFQLILSFLEFYKNLASSNSSLLISLKNKIIQLLYSLIPYDTVRDQILSSINAFFLKVFHYLYVTLINFTVSLPNLIIYLILISFGQFYLLIHGKKIVRVINEHLPFGVYNNLIIRNLTKTVDSLIFGVLLPPLVQATALVIILFLLGVDVNYFLVWFLGFIFGTVPSLGIWVVWVPLSIKVWTESTTKLLIYLLYNFLVTSNIDFIVRIFVTHKIADIPLWLVLFTSLGGLLENGFIGMILALFVGTFLYTLYHDIKKLERN